MKFLFRFKGGPGSGHRGHLGRPGKRGGSSPGTGRVVLTDKEMSALHDFTWLVSRTINSELREGNVSSSKPFGIIMSRKEQVVLIDSAISKALPLKEDTTLYSLMDAGFLKRAGRMKAGEVVYNAGYTSTTTRERGVASAPGIEYTVKSVLRLSIAKGTRGVLPLEGVSHYPGEKEHLIKRGISYRIDNIVVPLNTYIDPIIIDATMLE